MTIDITGTALTPLWLLYGVASSTALYAVKVRRPSLLLVFATLFALVDSYIPFSYSSDRILEIAPLQFMFALLRPAKMLMLAFGRGFLAREMSMKQHVILSILPVVPMKGLPEHLQKRIPAFRTSAAALMQLGFWLVVLVMGAAVTCSMDTSTTGPLLRSARHLVAFLGFMHVLLLGSALLASALGSEPVVAPFNSFWLAESIADWWSYRWNTVIGTSLRCTVYDPIVEHFKAGNRGKPVPMRTKLLAGCATFAYSAMIHEQALVNQRAFSAVGPLTLFFMLQPVLIVVQPWLADLATAVRVFLTAPRVHKQIHGATVSVDGTQIVQNGKGEDRHAVFRGHMGRATTFVLGFASLILLWCPAYDPPYSDLTDRIATATMKVLPGMLEAVPYCS